MNMRKAAAAAVGAALLAAGTGATAHGILDKNTTGSAKNSPTATGGDASASNNTSATVNASVNAKSSVVTHSGNKGIRNSNKNSNRAGNASAQNRGSNRSGSQTFHIV